MKPSRRVTVAMAGIFVLTLILCRAIQAAGSGEPGTKEIPAEGKPRPPVIIAVKINTSDVSSPGVEEMLADDNVSLPPVKTNRPGQPYIVNK